MNVAIMGQGFWQVQKANGDIAYNPAEHTKKDIVRYLCDARFVMNGPA